MVKKIIALSLLIVFIYQYFFLDNKKYMFNKHVIEDAYQEIKDLRYGQYALGMHSPYVYEFKLKKNRDLIQRIIKKHNLKRGTEIPNHFSALPYVVKDLNINLYQLMQNNPFYSIFYEGKYQGGSRILIITDKRIIFHTTGFIERENLLKVGYWYDKNNELQGLVDKSMLYGIYEN